MPEDLRIRGALPEDAAACAELLTAAWQTAGLTAEEAERRSALSADHDRLVALCDHCGIVGVFGSYKDTIDPEEDPAIKTAFGWWVGSNMERTSEPDFRGVQDGNLVFAHVSELGISPDHQGQGTGTMLALEGLKFVRRRYETGLLKFRLTQRTAARLALQLNEYGFRQTRDDLPAHGAAPHLRRSEFIGAIDAGITALTNRLSPSS